jgi:hypothetical protein
MPISVGREPNSIVSEEAQESVSNTWDPRQDDIGTTLLNTTASVGISDSHQPLFST